MQSARCSSRAAHEPIFGKSMVSTKDQERWTSISNGVGEALLDLERTFMNLIDRQSPEARALDCPIGADCFLAYMEAWAVLDEAHLRFVQLLGPGTSTPFWYRSAMPH